MTNVDIFEITTKALHVTIKPKYTEFLDSSINGLHCALY